LGYRVRAAGVVARTRASSGRRKKVLLFTVRIVVATLRPRFGQERDLMFCHKCVDVEIVDVDARVECAPKRCEDVPVFVVVFDDGIAFGRAPIVEELPVVDTAHELNREFAPNFRPTLELLS